MHHSNVKKKRKTKICSFDGCDNQAKVGGVCYSHGAKRKICSFDGCNNQAVKGGVCVAHGAEVKRCIVEGCDKQAKVGGVCVAHGAEVKRCEVDGCDNQVVKGGVCVAHGAERKLCKVKGCKNKVVRDGICIRHGGNKPNLPCQLCFIYSKRYTMVEVNGTTIRVCQTCKSRSKRIRLDTKEYKVLTFLKNNYKQPIIAANRQIKHKACVNRRRPDILYADLNRVLIIEVDEEQHKGYIDSSCEDKRISEIYDEFMGMEMIVVRFNPDGYRGKTKKLNFEQRLEVLLRTLAEIEVQKFDTKIHLYYLFYSDSSPQLSKNFSYTLID